MTGEKVKADFTDGKLTSVHVLHVDTRCEVRGTEGAKRAFVPSMARVALRGGRLLRVELMAAGHSAVYEIDTSDGRNYETVLAELPELAQLAALHAADREARRYLHEND